MQDIANLAFVCDIPGVRLVNYVDMTDEMKSVCSGRKRTRTMYPMDALRFAISEETGELLDVTYEEHEAGKRNVFRRPIEEWFDEPYSNNALDKGEVCAECGRPYYEHFVYPVNMPHDLSNRLRKGGHAYVKPSAGQ